MISGAPTVKEAAHHFVRSLGFIEPKVKICNTEIVRSGLARAMGGGRYDHLIARVGRARCIDCRGHEEGCLRFSIELLQNRKSRNEAKWRFRL